MMKVRTARVVRVASQATKDTKPEASIEAVIEALIVI